MMRRGMLHAVRRLPPSALLIPTSAAWYHHTAYDAASAAALLPPSPHAPPPVTLGGTHAATLSSASYSANDPIEDRWSGLRLDDDKLVVSVMDGHGGWQAADFAQSVLNATIRAELAHATDRDDPEQLAAAMTRAYERVDREFVARIRPAFEVGFGEVAHVGCCAVSAIVTPTHVVVANAGDCRVVFGCELPPDSAGGGGGAWPLGFGGDDSGSHQALTQGVPGSGAALAQAAALAGGYPMGTAGMGALELAGGASAAADAAAREARAAAAEAADELDELRMENDLRRAAEAARGRRGLDEPLLTAGFERGGGAQLSFAAGGATGWPAGEGGSPSPPPPARRRLRVAALPLSDDHNIRLPREQAAMKALHPGEPDVAYLKPASNAWYVKARLQPTRALGDAYLKYSEFNAPPGARQRGRHIPPPYTPPYITSRPETRVLALRGAGEGGGAGGKSGGAARTAGGVTSPRSDGTGVLIVGCDGVWDVMANEEAVRFVLEDTGDPSTVADRLVLRVLEKEAAAANLDVASLMALPPGRRRRNLHDDITVVVVRLGQPLGGGGGGGGPGAGPSVSGAVGGGGGLWAKLTSWLGAGGAKGG